MKLNQDKTIMTGVVKRVGNWGHTVPLAKKHTGMKVDYRGMLGNAQHAMRVSDGFNRMMLNELYKHLTELGERYYQGDLTAVDEFLQLYCIAADARAALVAPQTEQVKV